MFAPVACDSPQCDLETVAVRNWEGERRKCVDDGSENDN